MLNNPFTKQPTEKGELHRGSLSNIVGEETSYILSHYPTLSTSGSLHAANQTFSRVAKQLFVKAYQISLIHLENIY